MQYPKGDGHAFEDYVLKTWPDIKNRCVGRAEHSKRQDWICEASWKFHNLLDPIIGYTVSTVRLGANILRDSVLTRLENMHYEAYVHVCAILWKIAFEELRGLTNKKTIQDSGVGLNPMELNDLYDHMWNLGTVLQSDESLAVLEDNFRPWPRVRYNEGPSKNSTPILRNTKHLNGLSYDSLKIKPTWLFTILYYWKSCTCSAQPYTGPLKGPWENI